ATVGGHDEDPVIELGAGAPAQEYVAEHGLGIRHRGATDLLDRVPRALLHVFLFAFPGHAVLRISGPVTGCTGATCIRDAMNSGRGVAGPKGASRRFDTAL